MIIDVLIFVAGFALGGLFVFRGMRTAIKRELSKPPLSEEEQDERARQLLAMARGHPKGPPRTAGAADPSRAAAVAFCKAWVAQDPARRYAWE